MCEKGQRLMFNVFLYNYNSTFLIESSSLELMSWARLYGCIFQRTTVFIFPRPMLQVLSYSPWKKKKKTPNNLQHPTTNNKNPCVLGVCPCVAGNLRIEPFPIFLGIKL